MGGLVAGKLTKSKSSHSQPLSTTSSNDQTGHGTLTDPSFDDSSAKSKSLYQDLEFHSEDDESRREKRKAGRKICCAWTSFFIGITVLILLFLGIIIYSFLASSMPNFHLSNLTVNKLQFDRTRTDVFMTSRISVTLNVTNSKGQIDFSYDNMKAEIFSDDVFLGSVNLSGFNQKANNSTKLNFKTVVNQHPVAEGDASQMKSDLESNGFRVHVDLKGIIHFHFHGHKIAGFPFRVSCDDNTLSCYVKITLIS